MNRAEKIKDILRKKDARKRKLQESLSSLVRSLKELGAEKIILFGSLASFQHTIRAKKLDQYYIPTRYPNGLPGGIPSRYYNDPKEAEEAMNFTKELIGVVEKKIMEGE